MSTTILKCAICTQYFDGSNGYSFYKGKGLCPTCKQKLKEKLNEKENKEEKQKN